MAIPIPKKPLVATIPNAAKPVTPAVATPTVYAPANVGAVTAAVSNITAKSPTSTTQTGVLQGPGIANRNVTIPTPTPTKTQTTPPQNGTLQGPYMNPNTGQYQQGANVVNGQVQYNQPTTPTVNMQTTTPQAGLYQDPYARSREDIAKLASDRINKILQAGRTSAQGALTGAKNAYDYTNQIEGDNRTLRNADFKETNNPFSGKFAYDKTNMLRNDNIQDTAQDKDYQANVAQINQKLADLEAAAPGDEQAIIDQLEQIERQTGINVAQLQEQQKQNQFNNGVSEGNLTGNYNNQRTIQGQQFDLNKQIDQRNFDYGAGQDNLKNDQWNKTYDLQKAQQDWSNTFAKEQFTYQKASDLWERTFKDKSFDQSIKQFSANLGVDYQRLNQSQQQFVADQAFKEKSLQLQQDQFDYASDPNNPDNLYKNAEINWKNADAAKLIADSSKSTQGIDEYDLLQVNGLAEQSGITSKTTNDELKVFVAGLKSKYGWDLAEAKKIESYLSAQQQAAKDKEAAAKAAEKPKKFGYRGFGG